MKKRTVVAVCSTCVDYADDAALLYRHGGRFRHLGNDSERCPGQGDDGTDDRATPISFTQFVGPVGSASASLVLAAYLQDRADLDPRTGGPELLGD